MKYLKGTNYMRLNPETMAGIIEEWLERTTYGPRVPVEKVVHSDGMFVVTIGEPPATPEDGI